MRPEKAPQSATRHCENCVYFYQHYVEYLIPRGSFTTCNCGHCRFPRLKHIRPDFICGFFTQKRLSH